MDAHTLVLACPSFCNCFFFSTCINPYIRTCVCVCTCVRVCVCFRVVQFALQHIAVCCSMQFELILLRCSVKICVRVRAFCVCVYVIVSISATLGATGAGWGACNDACAATPASPYSPTICAAPAAGLLMTLGLLTRFLRALRTAPGGSGLFLCPAGLPGPLFGGMSSGCGERKPV